MKRLLTAGICSVLGLFALLSIAAQPPQAQTKSTSALVTDAEVQAILQKYADVFNKHDAKALAELWAPQAVSTDATTGRRVIGRDAIQADFQESFKASPKSRLQVQLKNHRLIKPDILSVTGKITITGAADEESSEASFTALLVKQGDSWQIEEATESQLATPSTPYEGLQELEWMIGNWQDDVDDLNVTSEVKWSSSKAFLLRKYVVEGKDEQSSESGMQIIAWDPRSKGIRSWTFGADGSFGEATWAQSGSEWRIKFNHTNADGSLENGMQLINKVNDNTATVQIIGSELDGEPQPNGPAVKMVRK